MLSIMDITSFDSKFKDSPSIQGPLATLVFNVVVYQVLRVG